MASVTPPAEIISAFTAPVTRHTRRIEIHEQDGNTRWDKDDVVRLKSGQVTLDYSRTERRALDLVLDNSDGALVTQAGEFWYDKVIKVFRGVIVEKPKPQPKILVIDSPPDDTARGDLSVNGFRDRLSENGFYDISVKANFSSADDFGPYDIIVSLGSNLTSTKPVILENAIRAGKSILAFDDIGQIVLDDLDIIDSTTQAIDLLIEPNIASSHPASRGWEGFQPTDGTGLAWPKKSSTPEFKTTLLADQPSSTVHSPLYAIEHRESSGRGVIVTFSPEGSYNIGNFTDFMISAMRWLDRTSGIETWETQIGEFVIDRITEPNFPHEVRITGRDYTKRALLSKFERATQFPTGQNLEAIITSIASSAGLSKLNLPVTGITVNRSFFFERGVERWSAIVEICGAYNYDVYFDNRGYLVMTPIVDPSTTEPSVVISTGQSGNLVSWEKSATDTRLYNHVLVTNESSDSQTLPMYSEAKNEDPNSPTSIGEIGDRLYQYTSSFFTQQSQLDDVAESFLAVHSLEEFELNFDSLMLPWLDVGEIIQFNSEEDSSDPTRFLLSSINLPLSLGPMSGNGKRVVIVE